MSDFMDGVARFACPNCNQRLSWAFVRQLFYRNRVVLGLFMRHPTRYVFYVKPEREQVRCYACLMDLHLPKRRLIQIEVVFWAFCLALFVGGMYWILQWPSMAPPPSVLEMTPEEFLQRIDDVSRGIDPYVNIPLRIIGWGVLVFAFSSVLARIISYRFVRLERKH